VDTDKEN